MTAIAAPYVELLADDAALAEPALELLDENEVAWILRRRYRSYLAQGCDAIEALLLAVGYSEVDLVALAGEPLVLQ